MHCTKMASPSEVGFPANETFREKMQKLVAFCKLFHEIFHFFAKINEAKFREKCEIFGKRFFMVSLETLVGIVLRYKRRKCVVHAPLPALKHAILVFICFLFNDKI